jgi:alginate O-acetyltransferase complex protein AlgI
VTVGWVLFRAADISSALDYLGAMFGVFGNPLVDDAFIYQFSENKVHFLVAILACVPLFPKLAQLGEKLPYAVRAVVRDCFLLIVLLVALAALAKGSYNPFIYFNF